MKTYSLVQIGRDTFLMLNADKPFLNNQCSSSIFENKDDARLDINVFAHFGLYILVLSKNLDRRTKRFKQFEKEYQYFSASFLPKIKQRMLSNSLIPYKY
jgi:hypothetical protein